MCYNSGLPLKLRSQNNNENLPHSAYSRERAQYHGQFFEISFDSIDQLNKSKFSRDSWVKFKLFFNRRCLWRCCRCCSETTLCCLGSERLPATSTISLFGCLACVCAFGCFVCLVFQLLLRLIQIFLGTKNRDLRLGRSNFLKMRRVMERRLRERALVFQFRWTRVTKAVRTRLPHVHSGNTTQAY